MNRRGDELTEDTVEVLIRRCRAGEKRAYEALFRQHAGIVHSRLRVLLGPSPDLEDRVQEVFFQAFSHLDKYDGRASFAAWLRGFALNVARNAMRAKSRRRTAMQGYEVESTHHGRGDRTTPERQAATAQLAAKLDKYLEKVSAHKRVPFILYYVEQLELQEVAEQVGASVKATAARIMRVRLQVKEALEREEKASGRRRGTLS